MEKVSLPIKTKIAAWWMILFGIFLTFSLFSQIKEIGFEFLPLLSLFVLSVFISVFFLFKGKKWGWWLSVILLPSSIFWPFSPFFPLGLLIPFIMEIINIFIVILLLLDRKNFWKIAT